MFGRGVWSLCSEEFLRVYVLKGFWEFMFGRVFESLCWEGVLVVGTFRRVAAL
jgi:hypothetical protein